MKSSKRFVPAEAFDKAFEKGRDVTPYLDLKSAKARHPIQRINVDVPKDLLEKVDEEAARIGVPRTSLIKIWLAEKLDRLSKAA
ncbi:MAG: ribbon-helix-helix protein, CopG family [Candidatus Omnitrophica bacterium]|nr:ribbon-helix-helix protein, CopG family [Candidatus Omnitrophota bacterium]